MKSVVQRVTNASVTVEGVLKGRIKSGLLVYIGVGHDDTEEDACWMAKKIACLRIFEDDQGKMNVSLNDLVNHNKLLVNDDNNPGVLAVSQFTLMGDARKGRRPSWGRAALPEKAKQLYECFIEKIREQGLVCECGEFQAHMMVTYTNDGPVTILLDSKE